MQNILEVVDAYICSREYQMRGLPHTHNVFWFQYDDKIKTEADIDNKISSEIPDKDKDLILYEAGPCNAGKACFVIGFVQKDFLSLLVKKFS